MKSHRHIIATLLLVVFSCIQLLDLHSIGHDADHTDCKICVLASENLNSDFTSVAIFDFSEIVRISTNHIASHYVTPFIGVSSSYFFLNKAPPIA
ncbi:hypothetical protein GCM10022393_35990 [Aquimarina addita]|uniref:Uncharacterized protein n=1 Tax=Aquimarina addita TaxID=870485 RepID=A0ABP6UTZ3_9FLAO